MKRKLTPIDDALQQLLSSMQAIEQSEEVLLDEAFGRILAKDLVAPISSPPHDSSAMDGYAVRSSDSESSSKLKVTQRIPAGSIGTLLGSGEAARIFTGAPLPPGADSVVMQENTSVSGDELEILQSVALGENVRSSGEDIREGALIFEAGHRIKSQDLGVLASMGMMDLTVKRKLKVALLTTGDEIVMPGEALKPGQIYNSNGFSLRSLLSALQIDVVDIGSVADDFESTRKLISLAADSVDCVITTGGVSVGEEDHVRDVIEELGSIDLWKLAIKPGKPFASGRIGDTYFFGLPGNPVSAFVTFVLLVRPCLLRLLGNQELATKSYLLRSGFSIQLSGERQEYLRVKVHERNGESFLQVYENQSSGVTASISFADGLALIPPHASVAEGDVLRFIPFSELVN